MRRTRVILGICLLALVVAGVACTAQAFQGGSTQQLPTETDPFDGEQGSDKPTVPVSVTEEIETVAGSEKNTKPKRYADTLPKLSTPDGRPHLERVPFPEQTKTIGEVPDELLQDIINDLVARTGAAPESIEVQRAKAVVWRDGSLGCPRPGMMYIQALVDGYWVMLGHVGESYDYRVNSGGYFALCEEGLSLRSGPLDRGGSEAPTQ